MTTEPKPTCVIADDHQIVVLGLAHELDPFVNVVGTATNGFEAIELVQRLEPDLLFLDIRMPGPGVDGVLEALRVGGGGSTNVVIFSTVTAIERVRLAFDRGVRGYVSKDAGVATLRSAVEAVTSGGRFLDPLLAPDLVSQASPPLSAREHEVLEVMAQGVGNSVIADRLDLSEETVKTHISHILRKLDCGSRTGAVANALRQGVLD